MFALVSSRAGSAEHEALHRMATALRNGRRGTRYWLDVQGRAGFVADNAQFLPQDHFDHHPLAEAQRVLVASVRIDNRPALEHAFALTADEAARTADSSLLLMAYRRWGEACVQHLVGDYAFAVWDRISGRLFAATDCFGTMPLWYATVGPRLIAASQLGAVLVHPDVPHDLDLDSLALMPMPKSVRGTTPYRAVRRLPGGHVLIHDDQGTRLQRWWNPETGVITRHRDRRDYAEQAGALLRQAVESALRSHGPVASTLSGGLDSTLATALAAHALAKRGDSLNAYTAVPEPGLATFERPGWESNDFAHAAKVAALHTNVRHVAVSPQRRCTLALVPEIHAHSHTPTRNSGNYLWLDRMAAAVRASGGTALLIGDKGNSSTSLSGDRAVHALVRSLHWLSAWRLSCEVERGEGLPVWRQWARAFVPRQVGGDDRFPGLQFLSPHWAARLAKQRVNYYAGLGPRSQALAFQMRPGDSWSADAVAQWGIQLRDPFADRRLAECLLTFPLEAFVQEDRFRGLARAIGQDLLPENVRLRRNRGAQLPEAASLVALHAKHYLDTLDLLTPSPTVSDLFDLDTLRRAILALRNGDLDPSLAITVDRVLDVACFIVRHEAEA